MTDSSYCVPLIAAVRLDCHVFVRVEYEVIFVYTDMYAFLGNQLTTDGEPQWRL